MHFRKKILIGGSVLHFAFNEDVVWGAGVRDPTAPHFFQSLDVCAVRGKMTEEFLQARGIRCTGVCGDPGILVGDLFPEVRGCTRDVELGVIPHYSDFEKFARIYNESENIEVIDPRRKAQDVIADIARCGLIVSSSLHGLIVADALGIPSKWAMPSKAESKFKYLDYYSIGENVPVCHSSIEQAVSSKSGVSRFYIPPDRTDALRQSFGAVLEGL
jgi:pyruvyltransferase